MKLIIDVTHPAMCIQIHNELDYGREIIWQRKMAKKNTKDSTPIEFYIPPSSAGGKGPRIPIPVNQPNWKYKHNRNLNSKPDFSEWLGIGIILGVVIVLGIFLIAAPTNKSPLWIVVVAFGVFSIFLTRSAIIRTLNYKQKNEEENNIIPSKRKKKLPKHRKDYK